MPPVFVRESLNTHSECEISNDPREGFRAHKARYLQLQTEWEAAYAEFERATQEFNDLVKSLRASDDKFSSRDTARPEHQWNGTKVAEHDGTVNNPRGRLQVRPIG